MWVSVSSVTDQTTDNEIRENLLQFQAAPVTVINNCQPVNEVYEVPSMQRTSPTVEIDSIFTEQIGHTQYDFDAEDKELVEQFDSNVSEIDDNILMDNEFLEAKFEELIMDIDLNMEELGSDSKNEEILFENMETNQNHNSF